MRSLSNLDASFLNLETQHTPMHMVGTFIFRDIYGQRMTAAQFRRHLNTRVNASRIFRERLLASPLGLGHAWWADDPAFALENHLHYSELDAPLTQTRLEPLANAFFTPLLNREHPLWEVMFVSERHISEIETSEKTSRFAVILKVHHAACDGLSAKTLIASLFDGLMPHAESDIVPTAPALPSSLALLAHNANAARHIVQDTRQLMAHIMRSLKQSAALRLQQPHKQPMFFTAPPSPFNIGIDQQRQRFSVELSLPLLKKIRQAQPNTTINDIVLTICGAALRRYLISLGRNSERTLQGLAPVSKRADGHHSEGGNKVSAMLIGLGTDIDDPVERLHTVRNNATRAKQFNVKTAYEQLFDYAPKTATGLLLRAYTRSRLANALPPVCNTIVTNIAALPASLNLNGAPLESVVTFAPIFDAMALSIVVLSYKDTTTLGITSTPEALTHPALFATCLRQAQDELALATGVITGEIMRATQPQAHSTMGIRVADVGVEQMTA